MSRDASLSSSERAKLHRLLERYRDLLVTAQDELLRRGIQSQIQSLEEKLRDCAEDEAEPAGRPPASTPA